MLADPEDCRQRPNLLQRRLGEDSPRNPELLPPDLAPVAVSRLVGVELVRPGHNAEVDRVVGPVPRSHHPRRSPPRAATRCPPSPRSPGALIRQRGVERRLERLAVQANLAQVPVHLVKADRDEPAIDQLGLGPVVAHTPHVRHAGIIFSTSDSSVAEPTGQPENAAASNEPHWLLRTFDAALCGLRAGQPSVPALCEQPLSHERGGHGSSRLDEDETSAPGLLHVVAELTLDDVRQVIGHPATTDHAATAAISGGLSVGASQLGRDTPSQWYAEIVVARVTDELHLATVGVGHSNPPCGPHWGVGSRGSTLATAQTVT